MSNFYYSVLEATFIITESISTNIPANGLLGNLTLDHYNIFRQELS